MSISRAELILKVDETIPYNINFGYPAQLALIGCSSAGDEELVWDQLETTDFVKYGGTYDAVNKQYVFNIARQMQKIIYRWRSPAPIPKLPAKTASCGVWAGAPVAPDWPNRQYIPGFAWQSSPDLPVAARPHRAEQAPATTPMPAPNTTCRIPAAAVQSAKARIPVHQP